ncbi:MAG: TetR/AcrR family transcriptional regulator [Acidobacteriota bacterium]|nr:TetR/AcrR family transcriptional regulator [Blastocatellia bacterium]MDQ3490272.1 TetR/AcrR family transcriptional regulator [Acidobacteriota bacterium]
MIKDFFNCEHVGKMTGDKRREQILLTAVSLFSQRGFSGTTTKEIARAAGVSEAMVFRHFSTKSELYGAILDNKACHDGVRFPWDENPVLQEAIKQKDDFKVFFNIALNALTKQQADENFMRLLFYSALEEHELADRFFNEFVARLYEFIGNYIEGRQKDGAMREINPRIVVRAFLGMMIHHSLNNILWDKKRRLLDISNEEAAKNFAEIILHGVSK